MSLNDLFIDANNTQTRLAGLIEEASKLYHGMSDFVTETTLAIPQTYIYPSHIYNSRLAGLIDAFVRLYHQFESLASANKTYFTQIGMFDRLAGLIHDFRLGAVEFSRFASQNLPVMSQVLVQMNLRALVDAFGKLGTELHNFTKDCNSYFLAIFLRGLTPANLDSMKTALKRSIAADAAKVVFRPAKLQVTDSEIKNSRIRSSYVSQMDTLAETLAAQWRYRDDDMVIDPPEYHQSILNKDRTSRLAVALQQEIIAYGETMDVDPWSIGWCNETNKAGYKGKQGKWNKNKGNGGNQNNNNNNNKNNNNNQRNNNNNNNQRNNNNNQNNNQGGGANNRGCIQKRGRWRGGNRNRR
ncbi:Serine/threonine-protein kinase Nek4 [Agyrium rufum]|nr:Serine/threonine-protein kinase Nek4 [Agyrium rufum]